MMIVVIVVYAENCLEQIEMVETRELLKSRQHLHFVINAVVV